VRRVSCRRRSRRRRRPHANGGQVQDRADGAPTGRDQDLSARQLTLPARCCLQEYRTATAVSQRARDRRSGDNAGALVAAGRQRARRTGRPRLPGLPGGGQDSHGQQNPHRSGGRIGDRIRAVEAGHGCLRGRRGADQQRGPACPAPPGPASARGPHTQDGRGQRGRGKPRGWRRVPGCCQDETTPGQVQHYRGEQHHGDQRPTGPGPGGGCCLLAVGAGSGDVPGHAVGHQHAIASCSCRCRRNASSA
jgi:hypothetical protein